MRLKHNRAGCPDVLNACLSYTLYCGHTLHQLLFRMGGWNRIRTAPDVWGTMGILFICCGAVPSCIYIGQVFWLLLIEFSRSMYRGTLNHVYWMISQLMIIQSKLLLEPCFRLIHRHWKAVDPPTVTEWIAQIRDTLRLEKFIFQHKGRSGKFDKLWAPWLDTPGLSPVDLALDKL